MDGEKRKRRERLSKKERAASECGWRMVRR